MFAWFVFMKNIIWKSLWADLNLFGKVLFCPLFVVMTLCTAPIGIFELVTVDPFLLLMFACSKTMTIKDLTSTLTEEW